MSEAVEPMTKVRDLIAEVERIDYARRVYLSDHAALEAEIRALEKKAEATMGKLMGLGDERRAAVGRIVALLEKTP